MVRGLLESAGIPSIVQAAGMFEGTRQGFGGVPVYGGAQKVMVHAHRLEEARRCRGDARPRGRAQLTPAGPAHHLAQVVAPGRFDVAEAGVEGVFEGRHRRRRGAGRRRGARRPRGRARSRAGRRSCRRGSPRRGARAGRRAGRSRAGGGSPRRGRGRPGGRSTGRRPRPARPSAGSGRSGAGSRSGGRARVVGGDDQLRVEPLGGAAQRLAASPRRRRAVPCGGR